MTTKEPSHKQLLPLTIVLALSLMLTTSNLSIQPAIASSSYGLAILDFSFIPQVFCIEKHDTVVWTNDDPVMHTLWFVRADDGTTYLLSDPIAPGEAWSHTFNESVTLVYYDFKRLWITGELRIYKIFGDIRGPENPPGSGLYPPDGVVDGWDYGFVGLAFGKTSADPDWEDYHIADFRGPENPPGSGLYPPDGVVDGWDYGYCGLQFGKIDP